MIKKRPLMKLLNEFTFNYGIKAQTLFQTTKTINIIDQCCLSVIIYMLYKVYEVDFEEVSNLTNRNKSAIYQYVKDVQEDFDSNSSQKYGKMFDELFDVLDQGKEEILKSA